MNYQVNWTPRAENELAEIWLKSDDRKRIARAADEIDKSLRSDPENQGESREKGRRIFVSAPLGVIFEVRPAESNVLVLTVWRFTIRTDT